MDPALVIAITNALAQMIPAGISLYNQLEQNNQNAGITPLATVLANADANWDDIAAVAKQQAAPPPPNPPTA